MDELHYADLRRICDDGGLAETGTPDGLVTYIASHGICMAGAEEYAESVAEVAAEAILGGYSTHEANANSFMSGMTLGLAVGAYRSHNTQRAIERGRHAYEMLLHHRGNDVATLAWVRTFLNEGGSIWSRR